MDISAHIESFANQRRFPSTLYKANAVKNILLEDRNAALVRQPAYQESEFLPCNIKLSVRQYAGTKDTAIHIYRDFLKYLRRHGIDVEGQFPPISISNTFERLMFIAKYLQDPRHTIAELPDRLWVSDRTIEEDLKRLRGNHEDPVQICGKVFTITDMERRRGTVRFPSTAHPLFLTPNLTQVLVTLKGLKAMSTDPLYTDYARLAAADIWEQLSDYAKSRIRYVLSELLPEDLSWYESLNKTDDTFFHTELQCSSVDVHNKNVFLHCMKNDMAFCVEYQTDDGPEIYSPCRFVHATYDSVNQSFEVTCPQGRIRLFTDRILRCAYTPEELAD